MTNHFLQTSWLTEKEVLGWQPTKKVEELEAENKIIKDENNPNY